MRDRSWCERGSRCRLDLTRCSASPTNRAVLWRRGRSIEFARERGLMSRLGFAKLAKWARAGSPRQRGGSAVGDFRRLDCSAQWREAAYDALAPRRRSGRRQKAQVRGPSRTRAVTAIRTHSRRDGARTRSASLRRDGRFDDEPRKPTLPAQARLLNRGATRRGTARRPSTTSALVPARGPRLAD